jgi:hypothetical protein
MIAKKLSLTERQQIFRDLVTTQDEVHDVARSRELIAHKFGISSEQLRSIEDEGIDRQWPPLDPDGE